MKRLRQQFLTFLEIIGLRPQPVADYETRLARLRLRYFHFRDLLSANDELLEIISELETRLQSESHVTQRYVRARTLAALTCAHRLVAAYRSVAGQGGEALTLTLGRIQRRLSAVLVQTRPEPLNAWVVPLEEVDRSSAPLVGNKMAVLGEIRTRLGLPVPGGFVITVAAFNRVLDAAGGLDTFHLPRTALSAADIEAYAAHARQKILETPIAAELVSTLRSAYRALDLPPGRGGVSVRSSAIGEDTEVSFAGQYLTMLNVGEDDLADAYRRVLASAYEPEAVFYRHHMGMDEIDVAVAVGCMAMVDAVSSGVAFSRDPVGDPGTVVIHASWGLGPSIVEGGADPDVYVVPRDGDLSRMVSRVTQKPTMVRNRPDGGVGLEAVPVADQTAPSLPPELVAQLARWAVTLEEHFGAPQDVEWALGRDGGLVVLQSRPSNANAVRADEAEAPAVDAPVLFEGGMTAAHGAGAGPVVVVGPDDNLDAFPEGGVLVAAHSSPRFVRAMEKASAIVTGVGSAIGHMASISREFRVPTIVGATGVTDLLGPGLEVTVDATRCRVYAGRVIPLVDRARHREIQVRHAGPAFGLLQEAARYIVPLGLTDPRDPGFTPLNCHSLHDLARYIHERSFQEMFAIGDLVGDFRTMTPVLDVFLPIDLYVIDLGNGLSAERGARKVKRHQITSPPFASLVTGMLHRGIPRFGPRAISAKGFARVVMEQAFTTPESDSTLRDPSYAIISERYVNLSTRVGFHFSTVDAYCSDLLNQNYITFRFKGGAADVVRRARRVLAISRILRELEFSTEVTGDLVTAQYAKHGADSTLRNLEMLGRLLQFMRQMDAAMTSAAMVDKVVADFLAGRYGLE